jgi:UDP:flavonoid glycosyltransferase YjiC (YdhE family)
MSAQRETDRGVGLSVDPTTADASTVRASLNRLLGEPAAFAAAAREVRAEMATQPSPAAVIQRLAANIPVLAPHLAGLAG